jgi:putative DNA primase/helicase
VPDYSWIAHLDRGERGLRANLSNAVGVLQHDGAYGPDVLWRDEFLDRLMTCPTGDMPREWDEADTYRLTAHIQQTIGIPAMTTTEVKKAVHYVASQRLRHVVRDNLSTLTWDDTPRIDLALEDHWGVECGETMPCAYVRAVSANLFLGLVARVLRPGCQLDTMVVFEGGQGIGKTSALRILGGAYYAQAHESVTHKDFFEGLQGKWVIEIGELDAFSRAEVSRVKTVISTPTDRYRVSYGHYAADHPRQCIFAGTTNHDGWGADETGLRRFWPIRCGLVNLESLATARTQLLAEAVHRVQAGEPWWITPTLPTLAVQADRQADDAWTDLVFAGIGLDTEITVAEVLIRILKFDAAQISRADELRVGRILRLAGWTKKNIMRRGKQGKRWVGPANE